MVEESRLREALASRLRDYASRFAAKPEAAIWGGWQTRVGEIIVDAYDLGVFPDHLQRNIARALETPNNQGRMFVVYCSTLDRLLPDAQADNADDAQTLCQLVAQLLAPQPTGADDARGAIKVAVQQLLEKPGIKYVSQIEIAGKSGYELQTVKNLTPKMVASGDLVKAPNGRGFRVP